MITTGLTKNGSNFKLFLSNENFQVWRHQPDKWEEIQLEFSSICQIFIRHNKRYSNSSISSNSGIRFFRIVSGSYNIHPITGISNYLSSMPRRSSNYDDLLISMQFLNFKFNFGEISLRYECRDSSGIFNCDPCFRVKLFPKNWYSCGEKKLFTVSENLTPNLIRNCWDGGWVP